MKQLPASSIEFNVNFQLLDQLNGSNDFHGILFGIPWNWGVAKSNDIKFQTQKIYTRFDPKHDKHLYQKQLQDIYRKSSDQWRH